MSFHGESICQEAGCGLRVIRDYVGNWYHDARDLRAAGYVLDGEPVEPHRAIPDPIVVRDIALARAAGRARADVLALERQRRSEGQDGDQRADA